MLGGGWDSFDDAERREQNRRGEAHDARARRIANTSVFVQGVAQYRSERCAGSAAPVPPGARVFARARPLFPDEAARGEWECVTADPSLSNLVIVHGASERLAAGKGAVPMLSHQAYPGVVPATSDDELYELGVRELVAAAVAGRKATLFAYGMTGSGKTHSMAGVHRRAPAELLQAEPEVRFAAFELFGRKCFDLLSEGKPEIYLRAGEDGQTHVCGNSERLASGAAELEAMLQEAAASRETAATGSNATSSRSHAVYVVQLPESGGSFMMIDLAGAEGNVESFYHDKEQMAEAAEINASLMAVNSCLRARAAGSGHVPFRDSTLTRVLQGAFTDPDSLLAMLACVSPCCSHLERTTCTLRNAVRLLGDGPLPAPTVDELAMPDSRAQPDAPATFSQSRQPTAKGRKAEAMRSMAIARLFADIKASWGGEDKASWAADGWVLLTSELQEPPYAELIDTVQLTALCDQAKSQLESDDFNFAAFETVCVLLAAHASVSVSALVKRIRANSGLPLCSKCLSEYSSEPNAAAVKSLYTYNGKCPGCFKTY